MNKIQLSAEQFKIFETGNKATTPDGEYYNFPYWLKKNGADGVYELLTRDQIPGIESNYKRGGLESNKYLIKKTDGSEMDPNAFYFVLRLDKDPHAKKAAIEYALSVAKDNNTLSLELLDAVMAFNPSELKTSEEWFRVFPFNILDPDGWDRGNWEYSWVKEKITWEEFNKRANQSTITGIK